jgi:hypothetical protein
MSLRKCSARELGGIALSPGSLFCNVVPLVFMRVGLLTSSALNEVNDQDDDGNYEQEVDQAAANVADEAKKPEHDQDNNYSPEHAYSFRLS